MGYYTTYHLEVTLDPQPSVEEIIASFRAGYQGAAYALDEVGDQRESCKWYDAKSDLLEFSRKYPTVLFTLHGTGERNDDIWALYVKNGKCQEAKAQITVAPFEESKLQ